MLIMCYIANQTVESTKDGNNVELELKATKDPANTPSTNESEHVQNVEEQASMTKGLNEGKHMLLGIVE